MFLTTCAGSGRDFHLYGDAAGPDAAWSHVRRAPGRAITFTYTGMLLAQTRLRVMAFRSLFIE
jgi:hypothetical protein